MRVTTNDVFVFVNITKLVGLREIVASETMNELSRNLLIVKLVDKIRKNDFKTKAFIR